MLMWEEAAIKDDVIEYDIAFNIIYIMRTHVVVAKLRCPSLTNVHRPLETDDDLTAFFTWREPRRVSKSLTVQYDKVLYLIEDNELSRRAIGKYIEVWHYPDGRRSPSGNRPGGYRGQQAPRAYT